MDLHEVRQSVPIRSSDRGYVPGDQTSLRLKSGQIAGFSDPDGRRWYGCVVEIDGDEVTVEEYVDISKDDLLAAKHADLKEVESQIEEIDGELKRDGAEKRQSIGGNEEEHKTRTAALDRCIDTVTEFTSTQRRELAKDAALDPFTSLLYSAVAKVADSSVNPDTDKGVEDVIGSKDFVIKLKMALSGADTRVLFNSLCVAADKVAKRSPAMNSTPLGKMTNAFISISQAVKEARTQQLQAEVQRARREDRIADNKERSKQLVAKLDSVKQDMNLIKRGALLQRTTKRRTVAADTVSFFLHTPPDSACLFLVNDDGSNGKPPRSLGDTPNTIATRTYSATARPVGGDGKLSAIQCGAHGSQRESSSNQLDSARESRRSHDWASSVSVSSAVSPVWDVPDHLQSSYQRREYRSDTVDSQVRTDSMSHWTTSAPRKDEDSQHDHCERLQSLLENMQAENSRKANARALNRSYGSNSFVADGAKHKEKSAERLYDGAVAKHVWNAQNGAQSQEDAVLVPSASLDSVRDYLTQLKVAQCTNQAEYDELVQRNNFFQDALTWATNEIKRQKAQISSLQRDNRQKGRELLLSRALLRMLRRAANGDTAAQENDGDVAQPLSNQKCQEYSISEIAVWLERLEEATDFLVAAQAISDRGPKSVW